MKQFYLYRHEDVHGHSGLGTVAEGVIFDNGMVALTWLSQYPTVTTFQDIQTVVKLHSHGGRTVAVIDGRQQDYKLFCLCREEARRKCSMFGVKKKIKKC